MAIQAVVAAVAIVGSVSAQRSASKSRKKAAKAERAKTRAESARSKRQQIRQARLSRGEALNLAAVTGGLGSSGLAGAQASIQTQLGVNLSFLDTTENLTNQAITARQQAADALGKAQIFETVGTFAQPFAARADQARKKS